MIDNYNEHNLCEIKTEISDYSLGGIKFRYLFLALIFIWLPSMAIFDILNGDDAVIILEIIFYTILILWIYISFKISKIKMPKIIGCILGGFKWLSAIVAIFLTQLLTFSVIGMIGLFLSNTCPSLVKHVLNSTSSTSTGNVALKLVSVLIIGIVIALFTEEVIFRYVLLNKLSSKFDINKAIIITSLIFGIFHKDILGKFVFSMVLCILYLKTKKLIVPIILHMINNCFPAFFDIYDMIFSKNKSSLNFNSYSLFLSKYQSTVWIVCIIAFVICILYFRHFIYNSNL